MTSNLTPAINGLLGVLVGSSITTGSNYLLAVRKESAEAATSRLAHVNELKTAARLIADEFLIALKGQSGSPTKSDGHLSKPNFHRRRGISIRPSSLLSYHLKIGMQ